MKIWGLVIVAWVFTPISVSADEVGDEACLAYWQLRAEGLAQEHRIASAKLESRYRTQYQQELEKLKKGKSVEPVMRSFYAAMSSMLQRIDGDLSRTAELDQSYFSACPLSEPVE